MGRFWAWAILVVAALECACAETVCQRRAVGEHLCPELYVLGVQKGASTSLWGWIHQRYKTEIKIAVHMEGYHQKEVHYFDMKAGRAPDWYAAQFPVRRNESNLAMDGTPCYFRHWQVAERMKAVLPIQRLRFILSFRDPVDRAYSWYTHVMMDYMSKPGMPFFNVYRAFDFSFRNMVVYSAPHVQQCINENPAEEVHQKCGFSTDTYRRLDYYISETDKDLRSIGEVAQLLTDGLYGYILLHWFRFYDPTQFCVVFFDFLVEDFHAEMQHLKPCFNAFSLGVRSTPQDELPRLNKRKCERCEVIEGENRERLHTYLTDSVFLNSTDLLLRLIRDNLGRQPPIDWNSKYR